VTGVRAELDGAVALLSAHGAADPDAVSVRGLEALVAGAVAGAGPRAWLLPGRRERAAALLRGATPDRLDAGRPRRVVPPGPGPVARALQAVGLAVATGERAVVFCGAGSVGYGGFSEALHLAAMRAAPVTFVVAWYVAPGPFGTQSALAPAAMARALGLGGVEVDGHDAVAVRDAVAGAAAGPWVIEARLRPSR
jgi:TPP-dependent pyruvate/acetoin dehydrogenase alpha subunit